MIKKNLTCIECPKSCLLSVDIENCKVVKVNRAKCPKGEKYAVSEIENPKRIFTSTVLAQGLSLKMVPVRTDQQISKDKIMEAMNEIRKIRINKPVILGEVIVRNFSDLGVNLIAAREAK